jgi:glycogen operon protein
VNYWGYQPISFFAPHHAYSSRPGPLAVVDEFRDMVKALHRAGIEVILDVVYNHTTEGGADGPTLCYRGLANDFYYILEPDRSRYADYTGCGNTLNANQPIVRRLIQDSLRYWVTEMHVDGFRFDLASILSRDESGNPLPNPPVLWDIESDPLLAGTKLIAEAWDAAGLYQVGRFVGDAWQEWNGRARDDIRRFIKGDVHTVSGLATRLLGSPDIYGHKEREAEHSINFVTCHDGFTLNDLVSYNDKHNEANGHDNTDGANDNNCWNCGTEGPTDNADIEALRNRQVKNFMVLNLLAAGTPMLTMGDEIRPDATRQQQRLLPGQRDQLVRLDAPGTARRHSSFREAAHGLPAEPRHHHDGSSADAQRASRPRAHRVARDQAESAGLGRTLALPGLHLCQRAGALSDPRHVERLLGPADVRGADIATAR